jgi:hypothetical protein
VFLFLNLRFDEENLGVVHSDNFLKKLGLSELIPNSISPRPEKDSSRFIADVPLPQLSSTFICWLEKKI